MLLCRAPPGCSEYYIIYSDWEGNSPLLTREHWNYVIFRSGYLQFFNEDD